MNTFNYLQKATEAATANGEAFKSMLDVSLAATQKWASLNGELVRSLAKPEGASASELDLREQIGLQSRRLERTTEYLREMNDLCMTAQSELAKLGAQRAGAAIQSLAAQFDELTKTDALDASGFAEMLKSTLSRTGATYEEMFNKARELTESNLTLAMRALQPAALERSGRSVSAAKKAA